MNRLIGKVFFLIILFSCSKDRQLEPLFHNFSFAFTDQNKGIVLGEIYPGTHSIVKYGFLLADKPDIYIGSSPSSVARFDLNDKNFNYSKIVNLSNNKANFIKAFAVTNHAVYYSQPIEIKDSIFRQISYENGMLMFTRNHVEPLYPASSPSPKYFGATDSFFGFHNQNLIYQTYKSGPFAYCENLTLGGFTDWYVPSYKELKFFLQDRNYFELSDKIFLSSTELDSFNFLGANPKEGRMQITPKNSQVICRCVRRF